MITLEIVSDFSTPCTLTACIHQTFTRIVSQCYTVNCIYLLVVDFLLMSPGDILTAVESGVDVFDSACVLTATENGCAFTFHNSSSDCVENRRENRGATENIAAEPPSHQIDLNDEK